MRIDAFCLKSTEGACGNQWIGHIVIRKEESYAGLQGNDAPDIVILHGSAPACAGSLRMRHDDRRPCTVDCR